MTREIVWDHPVETDEETPRPVRVLCSDLKHTRKHVVAVYFEDEGREIVLEADDDGLCPGGTRIRNVAPKPVRHELWINLYSDGSFSNGYLGEAGARKYRGTAVETRRIVWHSDGSPVEDDDGLAWRKQIQATQDARDELRALKEEYDRVCKERDALKAECERKAAEIGQMQIEINRLNALVIEAVRDTNRLEADLSQLKRDVCSTVKSCDNCANGPKFSDPCMIKPCSLYGNDDHYMGNWEPKR